MAQATLQAPLWLDIKTVYIDKNFEKVLSYLHRGLSTASGRDSFYRTTIELLSRRVGELLEDLKSRPVYDVEEESSGGSDARFTFATRLVATYLLVNPDISGQDGKSARECPLNQSSLTLCVKIWLDYNNCSFSNNDDDEK